MLRFINSELVAKKNPDSSKYYFHSDHLGSSTLITDSGGALIENTSYDPWGKVLGGGTQSKFLYTGQEKDTETNLNYYNARYYSSDTRRFTQPDTIIQDVYNPQSLNRYSYVLNNPLKYTDPSGHIIEDACIVECALMYMTVLTSSPDFQTDMQFLAKDGADFQDDQSFGNGIALGVSLLSTATPNASNGGLSKKIGKVTEEVAKSAVTPVKSITGRAVESSKRSISELKHVVSSKANNNNILRINSVRVSVGPAPKYYEKLNSIQKVLAPAHVHIEKDTGFIELNWLKVTGRNGKEAPFKLKLW